MYSEMLVGKNNVGHLKLATKTFENAINCKNGVC